MGVPVMVMGLGEIGRAVARAALSTPELELVAAVDLAPERVGRSLAEVLHAAAGEVTVTNVAEEAFRAVHAALREAGEAGGGHEEGRGVVLHATGSRLEQVVGEIEDALRAGFSVVSTCEELACPWVRHPKLADHIDRLAQKRRATVVGVGVNPGFVLDRLLATLGQATGKIDRVHGVRVVDASRRREALQRKIGAGLAESDFNRGVEEGFVGHVGLMESAALAAMGVGHSMDEVDEEILPVFAEEPLKALWGTIKPGDISGVRQIARAFDEGREVARLELTIALGAKDPRDEITIHGEPPLSLKIPGGIPGDPATAWTVVHAAQVIAQGAEPGLITALDLPAGR